MVVCHFLQNVQEEEPEAEDPRDAIVHEHPLFEGISEEFLAFRIQDGNDGNLRDMFRDHQWLINRQKTAGYFLGGNSHWVGLGPLDS